MNLMILMNKRFLSSDEDDDYGNVYIVYGAEDELDPDDEIEADD